MILRSFSQSECDCRSSSTRRHKIEEETTTRRCRSLRKYIAMMIAAVIERKQQRLQGRQCQEASFQETCLGEILSGRVPRTGSPYRCGRTRADTCRSRIQWPRSTLHIRPVGREKRRCDRNLARLIAFCVDKQEFAAQAGIDFFVTGDVKRRKCRAGNAAGCPARLKAMPVEEVGNRQPPDRAAWSRYNRI